VVVKPTLSHDRAEETIEAKARWYQSLSMRERMEVFCSVVDLALSVNPHLAERNRAQPVAGRIQVIAAA